LAINWLGLKDTEAITLLQGTAQRAPHKQIDAIAPEGLTMRHWTYLAGKAIGERATGRWSSLNQKELNRLANALCCDTYEITGRAPFKDEFVTCGGIALEAVNPATLESRHVPRLFFAGEILDIDGITGGFNFQAAWTTAYTVAKAIANY
jgi:predicted flavoprotein YhiN